MNGGPEISQRNPSCNLIVNYLPQSMTDKEFYNMFITIGPLKSSRIMRDYKTGYSYGFGFVEYQSPDDASRAIAALNGIQIQHKTVKVSYARAPGQDIKNTNLYIQNLPRDVTEPQLQQLFAPFGLIVQKNLLRDKISGLPRGVAFVRYDKKSQADTAIRALHGTIPQGGTESLVVKVAEEHGKQKAAFYAGWQMGMNQGSRGGGRGGSGRGGGYNQSSNGGYSQGFHGGAVGAICGDRSNNRYNPMGGGGGNAYSHMYNWN